MNCVVSEEPIRCDFGERKNVTVEAQTVDPYRGLDADARVEKTPVRRQSDEHQFLVAQFAPGRLYGGMFSNAVRPPSRHKENKRK